MSTPPIMPPRLIIDFGTVAAGIDLPKLLTADGVEVRRGMAYCPFHENTDTPALSVYWRDGRWRFKCHGCGAHGDALDYVANRDNIGVVEAARKLDPSLDQPTYAGWEASRTSSSAGRIPVPGAVAAPIVMPAPATPSRLAAVWQDPAWQATIDRLVQQAEAALWAKPGPRMTTAALTWLRFRGLDDETIRRFRLGYIADHFESGPLPVLGTDGRGGTRRIWLPRGIVLPQLRPGSWHSTVADEDDPADPDPRWVGVHVRRLHPDVFKIWTGRDKFMSATGSTTGFIYPLPDDAPGRPFLLAEGHWDALIGWQQVGDLVEVGSVGSASASIDRLPIETRVALAAAPWLLVATDADAAGAEAAWRWREAYPHKFWRLMPPRGKDIGEFAVKHRGDLRELVADALDRIGWRGPDPLRHGRDAWRWQAANLPAERWEAWRRRSAAIQASFGRPANAEEIIEADRAAFAELVADHGDSA